MTQGQEVVEAPAPSRPASGRRMPGIARRYHPVALFALAAAWFLYHIDRPGVWTDEGVTLVVIHRTLRQLWHLWPGNDAPMMPYYLLMKGLRTLADVLRLPIGDVVLVRSVSGLAMAGAAVALYLLVRRHSSAVLALATTVTFVAMPGVLRYAQEARPYALMMLASAGSWLAWDVNRERRDRRVQAAYVVTVVFGALMHLFLLAQFAAQVAASLVEDWRRGARRPKRFTRTIATLAPLVVSGLIVGIPLGYIALHGRGVPDRRPMTPSVELTTLLQTVLNIHVWPVAGTLVLVAAALGAASLAWRDRQVLFVLGLWFAIPFLLEAAAGFAQPNTVRLRYWMALATPLAAFVGAGASGIAELVARTVGRALRRSGTGPVIHRLTVVLTAVAVAVTVLLVLPDDGYIRGNAGHGPVGATAPVMRIVDTTPNDPVLLVDSQYNGYAFAGYGLHYVVDNPYATPDPNSRFAWGFRRTPEGFVRALDGHGTVVFAHIGGTGGATASTLRDVARQLTAAGYHRIRVHHAGQWTIMVYGR